jgi:hypothetical protein
VLGLLLPLLLLERRSSCPCKFSTAWRITHGSLRFYRNDFSEPLKIIVGSDKHEFFVTKSLIISQSAFFKAATDSNWESGRSNLVILAEDDPKIFGIFLAWLTTSDITSAADLVEIPEAKHEKGKKDEEHEQAMDRLAEQLVMSFILGDRLLAENFQNSIMDAIVSTAKRYFEECSCLFGSHKIVNKIYENTPANSPLRTFMVNQCLGIANFEKFAEMLRDASEFESFPLDFIVDLFATAMPGYKNGKASAPWNHAPSKYHVRPPGA